MAVVRLASRYGRYGYRRVTAMLQWEGWRVNHKRVERIWRREGLKVPAKQPKRGRLWLTDGSCVRLRPQRRNHVWAYDFVALRTSDGKPVRLLTVVDEYTRECLAIHVGRSLRSPHVIECLGDLMVQRGVPEHLRSDNGPEFTARAVRLWLQGVGATTLFITPGSPWENGYVESSNGKLRDELLDRELFDTLWEVQVLTEQWRHEYNHQRPHSAWAIALLLQRPSSPPLLQALSVSHDLWYNYWGQVTCRCASSVPGGPGRLRVVREQSLLTRGGPGPNPRWGSARISVHQSVSHGPDDDLLLAAESQLVLYVVDGVADRRRAVAP